MSVDKTQATSQTSDPFAYLSQYRYALLRTFRKNGDAVATPIWFANENGKLYIWTASNTGKVKRIHNNSRVTLTPCDQQGRIVGDGREVEGVARILPVTEAKHANALLASKYGFIYSALRLFRKLRRVQVAFIEVAPMK